MKIAFIGDISAKPGRLAVKAYLEKYRSEVDVVIANIENAAHGLGATIAIVEELHDYGVDFFTSGNDIWRQQDIIRYMELEDALVIRPMNYPAYYPGRGYKLLHIGGKTILILNLLGTVFMDTEINNPFKVVDDFLTTFTEKVDIIFVDFHAEATSEKIAMGFYLDGRVSAVVGTHTHVQTADERILPKGTAYITDVGMAGTVNSVLWVKTDIALDKMLHPYMFKKFEVEEEKPWSVQSVHIEINEANTVTSIQRVVYSVE